jgi:phosphodiesterase/alkaline phosphatase D-like protein
MNKLPLNLAMVVTVGSLFCLLYSTQAVTQVSPTTNKAARVRITQGPEIERVDPDFAIIRWTSNNPGGSPVHYGIVHYGTTPTKLSETAKSPIRPNPGHSYTDFRVRLDDLKPRTTYYYTVDSMKANGKGDGVKSTVRRFTTPAGIEAAN